MVGLEELPAAFAVLEDCERSVTLAAHAEDDLWRVYWASSLALLRAVGHVLAKVDAERSSENKRYVEEWWARWNPRGGTERKPNIFADFIESERNLILKQYQFRIDPSERRGKILVSTTGGVLRGSSGASLTSAQRDRFVITDGPFKDKDGRGLLRESITWWSTQLGDIEARIARHRASGGGAR